MIDITGLNTAKVLKALYDHSIAMVQPCLITNYGIDIPLHICEKVIEYTRLIHCLRGKIIDVDLSDDSFNEIPYDLNNGEGSAAFVIKQLRDCLITTTF